MQITTKSYMANRAYSVLRKSLDPDPITLNPKSQTLISKP